jgi:putative transposase
MDAMYYKVRINGKIEHRALYTILEVNKEGKKEISGMYTSQSERAIFWLQVLTDLNNRGLKYFLIAFSDNLKGFSKTD